MSISSNFLICYLCCEIIINDFVLHDILSDDSKYYHQPKKTIVINKKGK